MPIDLETAKDFLQTTAIHGLGFVALTLFVMICLWFFFWVARLVIRFLSRVCDWIPQLAESIRLWFGSQMEMHKAVKASCDTLTLTCGGMQETLDKAAVGVELLVDRSGGHRERICEARDCDNVLSDTFHRLGGLDLCPECFHEQTRVDRESHAEWVARQGPSPVMVVPQVHQPHGA